MSEKRPLKQLQRLPKQAAFFGSLKKGAARVTGQHQTGQLYARPDSFKSISMDSSGVAPRTILWRLKMRSLTVISPPFVKKTRTIMVARSMTGKWVGSKAKEGSAKSRALFA
jgi:hypothetical protein